MINDNNREHCKLSDIINGGITKLKSQWDQTEIATDFAPLPAGTYECHIANGELGQSRKGTPQYTLVFKVADGEHINRRLWLTLYLTEAALPMAKRDLGKLGIKSIEQLEKPLPMGIRCQCKVALRRDDDGNSYNRLRSFTAIGVDTPERDPFAPVDTTETKPEVDDGNGEPAGDTSFDPAQIESESTEDASTASGELPGVKTDDTRWASAR